MIYILIIFAIEQLRDILPADDYFTEWSDLSVVETFGSLENQVEIYDICKTESGYYLVGGAVRYGSKGGMDAIVFYFEDGIEWYKTYGGTRDEAFLSCFYDERLYVSGYSYSADFTSHSSNFRTGFYMKLDAEGMILQKEIIDYGLDLMPTVIWRDNGTQLAGYLDNFGNTDIFMYKEDIEIYSYSGQDRIFRKEGEVFLGSTTSKELGAINRNLLEWSPTSYKVIPSDEDESYWYFSSLSNQLSLEGEIYADEFVLTKEGYKYTLRMEFPELECQEVHTVESEGVVYQYCSADYKGDTFLFDTVELYRFSNNIVKDTFYNSFTLLFSGEATLNGNEIESGTELGIGKYEFQQGENSVLFEVIENNVDVIVTTIPVESNDISYDKSFNRKLIYIPLIIIGNLIYRRYQS